MIGKPPADRPKGDEPLSNQDWLDPEVRDEFESLSLALHTMWESIVDAPSQVNATDGPQLPEMSDEEHLRLLNEDPVYEKHCADQQIPELHHSMRSAIDDSLGLQGGARTAEGGEPRIVVEDSMFAKFKALITEGEKSDRTRRDIAGTLATWAIWYYAGVLEPGKSPQYRNVEVDLHVRAFQLIYGDTDENRARAALAEHSFALLGKELDREDIKKMLSKARMHEGPNEERNARASIIAAAIRRLKLIPSDDLK